MAQDTWPQSLLDRTGISQADLAGFLHISRSAVNMACRNERMLPTPAHLQLAKIELALGTLPSATGMPFTSYAPLVKHFRLRARERRYEAAVMERYIDKYEAKMQQWEQRERFWRAAATVKPEGPEGERQAEWLRLLLGLLRFSPGQAEKKYYRFKAQMPLLLQEAETYEKWVAEWEQASIHPQH